MKDSGSETLDVEAYSADWFRRLLITLLGAALLFRVVSDRRSFADAVVTYVSMLSYVIE